MATRTRAAAKAGMTPGVRHSPNRSNGEVPFIGLDVGYGYTKIVFEDGQRIIYPSLVAPVAVTSIEPTCATIIAIRGLCAERLKYEPTRFFRSFALPT